MSNYTPGPWEAAHAGEGSRDGNFVITEHFVRCPGDDVAIASDVIDPESGTPSAANARLMAAAPAMYEALQDIHAWLACAAIANNDDMAQSFPHMEAVARAAIAKALGVDP